LTRPKERVPRQLRFDAKEIDATGIEQDAEFLEETDDAEVDEAIVEPFDPALIRVSTQAMTLDLLLNRIAHDELILAPDFQRKADIWKVPAQSRLIESVLIRIPLPAFYMDATDEDKWIVIDGLQRLTTLKKFVLDKTLILRELEFLDQLNHKMFDDIPRSYQRRILETQVTVYSIERGTPQEVKFNIFKRINTGGLPLSPQEIRHALNQGQVTGLLKRLASLESFLSATSSSIKDDRMADRELVLRFLAFHLTPHNEYKARDLDSFLNDAMVTINQLPQSTIDSFEHRFDRAMQISHELFGDRAFRKFSIQGRLNPINKALFESLSANLDRLSDNDIELLKQAKERFLQAFNEFLQDGELESSISMSTGSVKNVRARYSLLHNFIAQFLQEKSQ